MPSAASPQSGPDETPHHSLLSWAISDLSPQFESAIHAYSQQIVEPTLENQREIWDELLQHYSAKLPRSVAYNFALLGLKIAQFDDFGSNKVHAAIAFAKQGTNSFFVPPALALPFLGRSSSAPPIVMSDVEYFDEPVGLHVEINETGLAQAIQPVFSELSWHEAWKHGEKVASCLQMHASSGPAALLSNFAGLGGSYVAGLIIQTALMSHFEGDIGLTSAQATRAPVLGVRCLDISANAAAQHVSLVVCDGAQQVAPSRGLIETGGPLVEKHYQVDLISSGCLFRRAKVTALHCQALS